MLALCCAVPPLQKKKMNVDVLLCVPGSCRAHGDGMGPSWLNKRTAAATFLIAWAGVLHYNMMDVQKQLSQVRDDKTLESGEEEKPTKKTLVVKLSTTED